MNLSRFGRDRVGLVAWFERLTAAGGRVETVDEPLGPGIMEMTLAMMDELNQDLAAIRKGRELAAQEGL